MKIKVVAPPELLKYMLKYLIRIGGGSVLSSLSALQATLISVRISKNEDSGY